MTINAEYLKVKQPVVNLSKPDCVFAKQVATSYPGLRKLTEDYIKDGSKIYALVAAVIEKVETGAEWIKQEQSLKITTAPACCIA